MRDPTPASSSSSTRCSGVSIARRRANCGTVGARGGVRPGRRGAGGRARAAAGGHGRRRPFVEAHQRVQMEGVRTVLRGHGPLRPLPARVRRDCRRRRRNLSAADGSGGDRPGPDFPLLVSVHQLRLHAVLLRPAGTQGSVRPGAPEPAARGRGREGVSFAPQAADPDSLRAALRTVFAAREYRWSEPNSTWVWLVTQWHRALDWLEGLRLVSPVRYYLLLAVLTLALVASLVHLGWLVWRSLRPVEPVRAPPPPAAPPRDAAWYAAEARRLSAAGRFAEALGVRFVAAVLDLDERRVVQFHPSKTPAEYALEARLDAAGRSGLSELVASLYRDRKSTR